MTIRKSILGIILFGIQIAIALYFNMSADLQILTGVALVTFAYVIYKVLLKKYDAA